MGFDFKIENTDITKTLLLSKYSEETYMEYYLGIPVKKGLFRNPLRDDKNPTASFYRDKKGNLIFKDFGNNFSGNFISVVMERFGCSYPEALRIIANDFHICHFDIHRTPGKINVNAAKFKDEGTAKIQVEIKEFTKQELNWWGTYGITLPTLKKYRVYSCKTVFLNDNVFTMVTPPNFVFGYYGGKQDSLELWRCYYPLKREYRFLTNWPARKIQGFEMLPKQGPLLVITKSMKDVMCLHEFGIAAIAPNSEVLFISDSVLEQLKARFKRIVVFYDSDLTGITNMCKIKKAHPELFFTWLPRKFGTKDITDFFKKYGKCKTRTLILTWLKRFR